jgi:hypothetical protein
VNSPIVERLQEECKAENSRRKSIEPSKRNIDEATRVDPGDASKIGSLYPDGFSLGPTKEETMGTSTGSSFDDRCRQVGVKLSQ